MKKIKVLIVDDHTLVRDGIMAMLKAENDIQIVGEAASGKEVLEKIKSLEVDVILMDIMMNEMNGLEATKSLKLYNPNIEVILLSMEVNEEFVAEGIRNGVKAYLPKDISKSKLIEAIRVVSTGQKFFSDKVSQLIFDNFYNKTQKKCTSNSNMSHNISQREKEIMVLLAEGKSSQEISEQLFISIKTVDTHRYNLMQKLQLKNIAELIRYAIKHGYVEI